MNTVNANKTGFIFALFLGSGHLLWALLVAFGWAQSLINFVFWMHFIKPVYAIQPFSLDIALVLIAVTSTIGYGMGYTLGALWNSFQKTEQNVADVTRKAA